MKNEGDINCWEFKKCGREPGGIHSSELGVCPVSTYDKLDGVHNGTNGGRCCWIFYGAFFCGLEKPKTTEEQMAICRKCDFYAIAKQSCELIVVL
ncbi:MAG: hypothetical protein D3904_02135 [Candidatus Electrothrix sp. EH2]|nr:hypothetical protein [Candidatus Electrothrix sp. EH2]